MNTIDYVLILYPFTLFNLLTLLIDQSNYSEAQCLRRWQNYSIERHVATILAEA